MKELIKKKLPVVENEPITIVLSQLSNVKESSNGWTALCPAHDDQHASLSISQADNGNVLLHCHTGCKTEDIVAALELKMKDLFPTDGKDNGDKGFDIKKTYEYKDESGNLLYQVCRLNQKVFRQRRPNGRGGWIWNLKGVKRVLYRLPLLLEAVTKHHAIFIPEGEKDADNLIKLGLCATCNSGGAGKWRNGYSEYLRNANIIILPDNDTPGKKHAEHVAKNLHGIANEIRILELPGLPAKGDVTDWLNNDGTKEKLLEFVKKTPIWAPSTQEFQEANEGNYPEFHLTDSGNAKRMVYHFEPLLRYNDKPFKTWFVWDKTHWKEDTSKKIYEYADKTVRKIYEEASHTTNGDSRKELAKWAKSSETARKKRDMVFLASSDQSITVDINDFDSNPWLLNVLNCTLQFKSESSLEEPEPKEHDQGDYITKIALVLYDPTATCPKWDQFLVDIFNGDEALITFIQRAVGYSMTGDTSEQCLFFCYGTGKNGKTVFLETLKMLFGDYAWKAPSEMLMQQRYQSVPSDVAKLKGTRLVITSEIEGNRRLSESRVKDITGGDTITARKMYRDWFEFKPTHKLWIYGNHKPTIRDNDIGIWRRIKLIPFDVKISKDQQQPMYVLLENFKKELSGILNWTVRGYAEYKERGLPESDAVQAATGEYRNEMDVIGQFIEECCIVDPNEKVTAKELWNKYKGMV